MAEAVPLNEKGTASRGPRAGDPRVRRLDWRFLLPDPSLEEVGYLGPEGGLLEGLRLLGHPRRLGRDEPEPSAHSLVVVCGARPDLELACSRLRPGGFLYLECDRRDPHRPGLLPGPGPGAICRKLRRLGLEGPRAHLHWPDFEACRSILPLRPPAPLRFALRERLASRWLARLVGYAPAGAWVRCFSVVARRPGPPGGGSGPGREFAERLLAPLPARPAPPAPAATLLTPRFRTSRNVIWLAFDGPGSRPVTVAKAPRLEKDGPALLEEAETLRAIHSLEEGGFDSIPRVLAVEELGSRPLLVESALPGGLLSPARIGRDRARYCEGVTRWLIDFHRATRSQPLTPGEVEQLVAEPLQTIAERVPDHPLLERSAAVLRELRGLRLPAVCEHGDLGHPNLMELEAGSIGVLDWETARLRGLPAVDLFFFLAFVGRTAGQKPEQAFDREGGWATPWTGRYARALELEPACLQPLFAAAWIRALARLARDLEGDEGREWLREHPYSHWWSFALRWRP